MLKDEKYKKMIFLIIVIIVAFPLYRYIQSQLLLNELKNEDIQLEKKKVALSNPSEKSKIIAKITTRPDLIEASQSLAHHLGTKYGWYNPKSWTENDKKVYDILKYQIRNLKILSKLYYEVDAPNRNLKDDVYSYLDSAQLKNLEYIIKTNKLSW